MVQKQRLAVAASPLSPFGRRTGVTWSGCEIWIDLVRGVGAYVGGCEFTDRGLAEVERRPDKINVTRKRNLPAEKITACFVAIL